MIARLVDGGDFLEVHAGFAENIIIGFARIEGMVVGIIANQPAVRAGALDIDASDKGARFIRFCDCFNIPLVTLVDVPGFLPGIEQERGGIIRHGAKLLFAYAAATVPKITVILRKAYGGSYLVMCSQEMGADFVYAWPSAEIAVMGAEGAVNVLDRKELKERRTAAPRRRNWRRRTGRSSATPYLSAGAGYITDVIDPASTRWIVGAVAAQAAEQARRASAEEAREHAAVMTLPSSSSSGRRGLPIDCPAPRLSIFGKGRPAMNETMSGSPILTNWLAIVGIISLMYWGWRIVATVQLRIRKSRPADAARPRPSWRRRSAGIRRISPRTSSSSRQPSMQ